MGEIRAPAGEGHRVSRAGVRKGLSRASRDAGFGQCKRLIGVRELAMAIGRPILSGAVAPLELVMALAALAAPDSAAQEAFPPALT